MSDYSSMATSDNNSQSQAAAKFAAALQRAKLVAAKLDVGSTKRPLEEGLEPNAKKLASFDLGYQAQPPLSMSSAPLPQMMNSTSPLGGGPPGETLNEYIRVPDKMVGLIIGRGGEQITRLQAETGCKIQMAPPDVGEQAERVCTLTGSREAIARARELVNQIVNHRGRENAPEGGPMMMGGGGGGGPPPPSAQSMSRPNNGGGGGGGLATMEEIMLPGPKVGLIIGKNGKTIKQLQEQSGAKMVVIQDGPNTEYEKPLRISGDASKVEHAKQLVYELLAEKDLGARPPQQQQYDDYQDQGNGGQGSNTEVLVPKVAVGVVIGRGGEMIKKIQAETGCRVQFHQERDDGPGDKRCYLQGKPHQVEAAREMIDDLISSVTRREQELRSGGGGRGPRGGGGARNGGGGGGEQWGGDKQEVRVTFTVNNVKCGLIIGRRGEVIKQINAMTGAHCELDRAAQSADHNNRTFVIRGSPDSVEHCKRVIMEKCAMPVNFIHDTGSDSDGGGGSGGGGDMYGGGGGGGAPPAWGYNPHWHPANNQQPQQSQMPVNPNTGQLDYSRQWIDYYRSLGLMQEAEAIEMQMKQNHGGGGGGGSNNGAGNGGGGGGAPAAAGGGGAAPNGAGSGGADYSAQWAEYYRSMGKIKEAEAIEVQIKMKQQPGGGGGGAPAAAPGGPGGGGGMGGAPSGGGTPPAPAQSYPYPYPGMQYPYPYQQYPQDHQ